MTVAELIALLQQLEPQWEISGTNSGSLMFSEPGRRLPHEVGRRYGYVLMSGEIKRLTVRT